MRTFHDIKICRIKAGRRKLGLSVLSLLTHLVALSESGGRSLLLEYSISPSVRPPILAQRSQQEAAAFLASTILTLSGTLNRITAAYEKHENVPNRFTDWSLRERIVNALIWGPDKSKWPPSTDLIKL
jgi:hypothetical protein